MSQQTNVKGFTIIELMLAMSFVGVLLLGIAMATIYISNTYTRGITLREVNQIGRTISDDLYRTIGASPPIDAANDYKTGTAGGLLCTGAYTYVWNYGSALQSGASGLYTHEGTPIRFARVSDAGKTLCEWAGSGAIGDERSVTELIDSGDRSLAIHDLTLRSGTAVDLAAGQGLHAISFIIGTNSGAEVIASANCLPPSDIDSNQDYCAMNAFEIVARSGNSTGEE